MNANDKEEQKNWICDRDVPDIGEKENRVDRYRPEGREEKNWKFVNPNKSIWKGIKRKIKANLI